MRRFLLQLFFCLTLTPSVLWAQDETYYFQGYSVGESMSAPSYFPRAMMPDIIHTGTEYIMYFAYEEPGVNFIMYATSNDMQFWSVGDTIITGSSDPLNREYVMGGPRVIKLPSGQYRMFYRASTDYTTSPDYHIRSAISDDGKVFVKEGICIENKTYDPTSFFKHVGHSEFYYDNGNTLRALLTARDSTMNGGPDNIYKAESSDGGLTWSNFQLQYPESHDPVVIKDSNNTYHTYFTYLNTEFHTAKSLNGAVWPVTADKLIMIQNGDTITESTSPIKIADLGAGVDATGKIVVFSNHASQLGPWTHVAYWIDPTADISSLGKEDHGIQLYPNPSEGTFHLANIPSDLGDFSVKILNCLGEEVFSFENQTHFSIGNEAPRGVYFLNIMNQDGIRFQEKFILH